MFIRIFRSSQSCQWAATKTAGQIERPETDWACSAHLGGNWCPPENKKENFLDKKRPGNCVKGQRCFRWLKYGPHLTKSQDFNFWPPGRLGSFGLSAAVPGLSGLSGADERLEVLGKRGFERSAAGREKRLSRTVLRLSHNSRGGLGIGRLKAVPGNRLLIRLLFQFRFD
jgi:hypothetical protein